MIPRHYLFDTFRGERVHLGVCGSVAAYKALELTRALVHLEMPVEVTLTTAATQFVTPMAFRAVGAAAVHTAPFHLEDPFQHLQPGELARAVAVVPATANILAKMAHGLADDLLSTQLLACPGPVLVAPAMNPRMWLASATQANVQVLRQRGVRFVGPDSGAVACGDMGTGRLAPVEEIFVEILRLITPQDLAGMRILVTLGPTREYFDPARFWSNPSTGTMGASLAVAAALRGAEVTAVCGPVDIALPRSVRRIDVISAQEMFTAAMDLFPSVDMALCTAAVADFRPPRQETKYKKDGQSLALTFAPNPDILAAMGKTKAPHQRLLGFAAETGDLAAAAAAKLERKNADLMAANPIGQAEAGFASPTNRMVVVDRSGRTESWPVLPKTEVAWRLLSWLASL
ncbi:phosphopantothenoylcysteine decarboxylase [Thermodesulfomicrobium sp. WS]|uniref:bifunctional phosphopantothenoylcysteine decarboxylase/phosphopantothenate--cysteine ligase CoaBC n=1 Tax=Thermodesulfomicrobium sp. WS TaxID=3004129 RepID=UPI002491D5E0|nr:bifunctional phosphopantothenoylcysteine decarboxylase/phosphopantothenate--cysteine ligase CoaBC [Thermodesulfomicrobium sp. WS]BDV00202.1 phosphopantothenoylcysteine decarboxylase [Thermodesulfomicrobium sp. WS]